MLFSRYGTDLDAIMQMGMYEGMELIRYAENQKVESILMQRWITNYEKEMNFTEFKKQLGIEENTQSTYNVSPHKKTVDEILLEVKHALGGEVGP